MNEKTKNVERIIQKTHPKSNITVVKPDTENYTMLLEDHKDVNDKYIDIIVLQVVNCNDCLFVEYVAKKEYDFSSYPIYCNDKTTVIKKTHPKSTIESLIIDSRDYYKVLHALIDYDDEPIVILQFASFDNLCIAEYVKETDYHKTVPAHD